MREKKEYKSKTDYSPVEICKVEKDRIDRINKATKIPLRQIVTLALQAGLPEIEKKFLP